ncbi:MAG TPA: cyclic nucleotide-binding domain-containing protein [Spirochaetia bacterium]|nr:cyclic nucleotide-binding domain-containing protein [Spirochaetia bacterium]
MAENTLFGKYGIVVDSGKVLFRENDEGDQMYIIQEGSVRISKQIGGKEHILAVLAKGDFFGEMAIVNRSKRTATATAVGTVNLLAFNREGFLGMIEKNARIALNIIDKLCRRLQQADLQIHHLVRKSARGLVALNLFYAFAEQGFEKAKLDYVKLARDISLSLEIPSDAVNGFFDELKNGNIIEVANNKVSLLSRDGLAAMGEIGPQSLQ